jgi:hypothetical protein
MLSLVTPMKQPLFGKTTWDEKEERVYAGRG